MLYEPRGEKCRMFLLVRDSLTLAQAGLELMDLTLPLLGLQACVITLAHRIAS